jgi:hypothetical protein
MGAGSQRWWEAPPFAEVRPDREVGAPGRYAGLYVAGRWVGSMVEDLAEDHARAINAARGVRTMYLEDTVEKLKRHIVEVDATLENPPRGRRAAMLRAISDGELLAELDRRRKTRGTVFDPREADYWAGASRREAQDVADFYWQEYLGEFMTAPVPRSARDQIDAMRYAIERMRSPPPLVDIRNIDPALLRGLQPGVTVFDEFSANGLVPEPPPASPKPVERIAEGCRSRRGIMNCEMPRGHRGPHRYGAQRW